MSTDPVARPLDWKKLYQLAMAELDPIKLPQRITDARNVILDRIQETLATPSHYEERQELSDALNGLRVLRQEYEYRVQRYGEPRANAQKMG
jgi:hypothetical protein